MPTTKTPVERHAIRASRRVAKAYGPCAGQYPVLGGNRTCFLRLLRSESDHFRPWAVSKSSVPAATADPANGANRLH